MKYNSIGDRIIAKAKEIDPEYTTDKHNDLDEALAIILDNMGGGSKSVTLPELEFTTSTSENIELTDEQWTAFCSLNTQNYNGAILPCRLGSNWVQHVSFVSCDQATTTISLTFFITEDDRSTVYPVCLLVHTNRNQDHSLLVGDGLSIY